MWSDIVRVDDFNANSATIRSNETLRCCKSCCEGSYHSDASRMT